MAKEIKRAKKARQRRKEKYFSSFENDENHSVYLLELERAKRLMELLETINEKNKSIPVIVEGKKDLLALRSLGFTGEIITVHSGKGLYDFCHNISEKFREVILLLDWDDNGDNLQKKISSHLQGLWEEFAHLRETLRMLCQKDVKAVEDIPVLLKRLSGTDLRLDERDSISE